MVCGRIDEWKPTHRNQCPHYSYAGKQLTGKIFKKIGIFSSLKIPIIGHVPKTSENPKIFRQNLQKKKCMDNVSVQVIFQKIKQDYFSNCAEKNVLEPSKWNSLHFTRKWCSPPYTQYTHPICGKSGLATTTTTGPTSYHDVVIPNYSAINVTLVVCLLLNCYFLYSVSDRSMTY